MWPGEKNADSLRSTTKQPRLLQKQDFICQKRELASGNMALQNECLLQNISLSSLGFYNLYLQERQDRNDQVYVYKATATVEGNK